MSGPLEFSTKKTLYFIAILALSFLAARLFLACGAASYCDKVLYDRAIDNRVNTDRENRSSIIVTVDLNDISIKELEERLDTREAFADLIEVLAETGAIPVLDFLFAHEKRYDGTFIDALKASGNTIAAGLAVEKEMMNLPNMPYRELSPAERLLFGRHVWHIKVLDKGKIPEAGTFLLPHPALLEAIAQIGHINMDADSDGVSRRVHLLYGWEGGYIPSLPLAAAVNHLQIPIESIELKAGEYLALPRSASEVIRIPIDEQGRVLVPYTKTFSGDTKRRYFHTIVEAKPNDDIYESVLSNLSNNIAFAAEISTGQKDYGVTSFERLYPLSGVHVEVLGGILNGLQKRAFISEAGLPYKTIIVILFIAMAFLFISFRSDILFHFGFLFTLIAFFIITIFRWQNAAISPWFGFPAALLFLLWFNAFLNRLFLQYREQLLLHNALSRYFPRALAERIIREGKTDLTPVYKELTILFSDISGFTKWSSDKSPRDVHKFLSEYLESMAEILFAHCGTVDKFMGDGILAFFGDPFDTPDHTEQCIRSAIAMQEKVSILAEKWKPLLNIDLKVRVGINTGKVFVGNLGSKTRIEYTVIGAAVNLAQRMESNAPIGGILVTAAVMEKVKDKFNFPERRDVTVKGYSETIEAYAVEMPKAGSISSPLR